MFGNKINKDPNLFRFISFYSFRGDLGKGLL